MEADWGLILYPEGPLVPRQSKRWLLQRSFYLHVFFFDRICWAVRICVQVSCSDGVQVEIHYHVSASGVLLDTSLNGDPIRFNLGTGMVMEAWDRVVATMRKARSLPQLERRLLLFLNVPLGPATLHTFQAFCDLASPSTVHCPPSLGAMVVDHSI